MLADDSADYAKVFRRYVPSDDIASRVKQSRGRWIIDFAQIGLAGATKFARALASARDRVKPERDKNRDDGLRSTGWSFRRPRGELRTAVASLSLYIAVRRVGGSASRSCSVGSQQPLIPPMRRTSSPSTTSSPTSQPCTRSPTWRWRWRWRWPWRWPRPLAGRPPWRRTPPSSSRPTAHNLIATAPGGYSFRRRSDSSGKPVAFRPAAQSRTLNPPRPVPAKPPRAELSASGMRGVNDDLRVAEA